MTVVDINFFLHLFSLSTAYDTLTSILLPTIAFCRPKPITPASARERTPVPLRRWRGDFRSEIDRANFLRAKALYLRVSFFFFSSSRCVTFACPKGWMCIKMRGSEAPWSISWSRSPFPSFVCRARPRWVRVAGFKMLAKRVLAVPRPKRGVHHSCQSKVRVFPPL